MYVIAVTTNNHSENEKCEKLCYLREVGYNKTLKHMFSIKSMVLG